MLKKYYVEIKHKYLIGQKEEGVHTIPYLVSLTGEDFLPADDCMVATANESEISARKAMKQHLEDFFIDMGDIIEISDLYEFYGDENDFLESEFQGVIVSKN